MTIQTPSGEYVEVTVKGRDLARQLAHLIFDTEVRVYGSTTWNRDGEGHWTCTNMLVESFEVPDATGLGKLLADLQRIPGNEWHSKDDPIAEYRKWKSEDEQ
jgi:hypothetical protein